MELISGYIVKEKIYESNRTAIYRALRASDDLPVILKLLNKEYPAHEEITSFSNEYEILSSLNIEGIVKSYGVEKYRNSLMIILEDDEAVSVFDLLSNGKVDINEFLNIAIQISDILGKIHENSIIHKDINPSNIIIGRKNGIVKIIDFGIATKLSRENIDLINLRELEGTLTYIAPEQTGRMNRSVDYRSDFYSLGATFYCIITGHPPFNTTDPIELVHSHIAKVPIPPHELDKSIPKSISDIIMKLLSKTAEERYQSSYGIKHDLERCYKEFCEKGSIENFKIGETDNSEKFQIPEKLYGREKELEILMATFEEVCQGNSELVIVSGDSGIGKSSLVNEIYKPISRKYGYFISGKFDQFKRNMPYSSLIQSFQKLVKQILTESEEQILVWKEKLTKVLGSNGQLIIEVIPEVELIIGKQKAVEKLGPIETQNRFNMEFANFIRVFADKRHPLAMFLDDLHWADSASLNFIEYFLLDMDTKHILIIGSYRDAEVDMGHPLSIMLEKIKKHKVTINFLKLGNLNYENVSELLAETLKSGPEEVKTLTEISIKKTNGNPFFIKQFLYTLSQKKFISFNTGSGKWDWKNEEIRESEITDNVLELMKEKIKELPIATQNILKYGACIGNKFDIETLSLVLEKRPKEISETLWEALEMGLIMKFGELFYQFSHDRIFQAVYLMIAEEEKLSIHFKIGKILIDNTPQDRVEDRIFELVNHINKGNKLIKNLSEREKSAKLNLIAGKKAKASAAYDSAINYFMESINLLQDERWDTLYEIKLEIYVEASEAAYLSSKFDLMEMLLKNVLENATSLVDKVKAYEVKLYFLTSNNRFSEAIDLALEVLKSFGLDIPKNPSDKEVEKKYKEIKKLLENITIEDLFSMNKMVHPEKLVEMRIIMSIALAAYLTSPNLSLYIICEQVRLSIEYGNTDSSAYAYVMFGMILCEEDCENGYNLGLLALRIVEKYNAISVKAIVNQVFEVFINHWKENIRKTLSNLIKNYQVGLETGAFIWASLSAYEYCLNSYFCGNRLSEVEKDAANLSIAIQKMKQEPTFHIISILRGTISKLRGKSEIFYDEQILLPLFHSYNHRTAIFINYFHKLVLEYLIASPEEALKNSIMAEEYIDSVKGLVINGIYYFYDSLIRLALFDEISSNDKDIFLKKINYNQEKIKKVLQSAPMNYINKYFLIEAEISRVLGRYMEAVELYDKAIQLSKENGFLNEEAISNELVGKFWLKRGNEKIATIYIKEAHYCYKAWEADEKAAQMERRYPEVLKSAVRKGTSSSKNEMTISISSSGISTGTIDLVSIMKAYRSFSGEIVLSELLNKIMKIMIENAGAEKGILISQIDGDLYIEADIIIGEESQIFSPPVSVEEREDLSLSIVRYTARTLEILVLSNPAEDGIFTRDTYIEENKPKSILSIPILNQSILIGILYLENNQTVEAFTPERVEILKMLASQAAISIENARLYQTMEQRVNERTHELSDALENLKNTQQELVNSEKLAALGHLIAGIAHEINTPLGAIKASIGNVSSSFEITIKNFSALIKNLTEENLEIFSMFIDKSVKSSNIFMGKEARKIKKAFVEILEEHSILNADSIADILIDLGIEGDIEYLFPLLQKRESLELMKAAYELCLIQKNTTNITTAVEKASKVVYALKNYVHHEESQIGKYVDIKENIEIVLTLYHNQMKHGVEIIKQYNEIPEVFGYPDELGQVWTNVIHNSLQAMNYKGTLTIKTFEESDFVKVSISDTGVGIPQDNMAKIFEPFFTTKKAGEGTGLGLDIVKKIINKHKGVINCESKLGEGTTFTIALPK